MVHSAAVEVPYTRAQIHPPFVNGSFVLFGTPIGMHAFLVCI